jgi:hypothetical protein
VNYIKQNTYKIPDHSWRLGYADVPRSELCAGNPDGDDCKLFFHGCENEAFTDTQVAYLETEISGFTFTDYDSETIQKVLKVVYCDTKVNDYFVCLFVFIHACCVTFSLSF